MRLYIAGPMSGIPQFNFPAFHEAAASLRRDGFDIVSPAETDSKEVQAAAILSPDGKYDAHGKVAHETWGDMLARDVKMLADGIEEWFGEGDAAGTHLVPIDGIAFLPGWDRSRGARLEAFVGTLTKKLFYLYHPATQMLTTISTQFIMEILLRVEADVDAGVKHAS